MYYADLHLHSKHSRATARGADLPNLAAWAQRKGIALVGTGDFTHPAWREEIRSSLVDAEPGLLRLRPDLERAVAGQLPEGCQNATRFVLSVEISTIYKHAERTRKVHHVVLVPDLDAADRFVARLAKIGNLASDGRPILGLDSRDLLETVLESADRAFLIPAHIWTPWFSALGSQSGFDSIDECYRDLAPHIFAVETGLSSDPAMNWRVSSLDRFRLVSSSDAHSPAMLGREACVLDGPLGYEALRAALETGEGYVGTVEFFPEEGKYHLDGHRNCSVRLDPVETARLGGRCPECGRPLTRGVLGRVEALADRGTQAARPFTAGQVWSLVPLREILAELHGTGPQSKTVARSYDALLRKLGPELPLLAELPLDDVARIGSALLAEAVERLRAGAVRREAGFDGQYGVIRLFSPEELATERKGRALFAPDETQRGSAARLPAPKGSRRRRRAHEGAGGDAPSAAEPSPGSRSPAVETRPATIRPRGPSAAAPPATGSVVLPGDECALPLFPAARFEATSRHLDALDPDQRAAAEVVHGPLLVAAGPGSGKTRLLTHRIAHLVAHHGVAPEQCLAITFTRRAANEMRARLCRLLPQHAAQIPIATFHGLGLTILEEHHALCGLPRELRIADADRAAELWAATEGIDPALARRQLAALARARRQLSAAADQAVASGRSSTRSARGAKPADAEVSRRMTDRLERYRRSLREHGLVDFDDLVELPVALLTSHRDVRDALRARWPWLSIDEYQDIDARQEQLVRLLVAPDGNVCAIGDPDQAIYGFRGADSARFEQFSDHFPAARRVALRRNYRSDGHIVRAAGEVIRHVDGRARDLEAVLPDGRRAIVHRAPTDRAEAEHVVVSIERLLGGHTFFALDSGRSDGWATDRFSFADFAVLYRTEAQAPLLVEALRRAGMPLRVRSHTPLRELPIVRSLLDELWRTRDETARSVIDCARASAAELVRAGADAEAMAGAVELLTPLAAHFEGDVAAFVRQVELGASMDCWDPRADCVSLMTMHAAKGLEFPVVFVVGCEEGIVPLCFGPRSSIDWAEERRLLYVAMTRARERLVLSYATRRTWRGRMRDQQLSPLLQEVARTLCDPSRTELPNRPVEAPSPQLELFGS